MHKLLLLLFISLSFQACQVKEEVASANQITATTQFPGATLQSMLPQDGWKKLSDNIDLAFYFALPVTVTSSPYVEVQIGSYTRRLYYYSGSGTQNLIFRYTVTSADLDYDGIVFDPTFKLNGGTLTYSPQANVTENLPTSFTLAASNIKVDGVAPYFTEATAPVAGNYSTNQLLKYKLLFSEQVFVTGTPKFNVSLTSGTVTADYLSGSGSAEIVRSAFTNSCFPTSSCTTTQASGVATITFATAGSIFGSFIIGTPNGNFSVNLGTFNGTNTICSTCSGARMAADLATIITRSTNPIMASYFATADGASVSIYKGSSLEFARLLQGTDIDVDGFSSGTTLNLSSIAGITILDQAGNSVSTTISATTSTSALINVVQPTILSVTPPGAGTYIAGQTLNFTVLMSEAVNITGTPSIPITLSTGPALATYVSGTGTNTLIYTYTVLPNHVDANGITLVSPMVLNGGTIKNLTGDHNAALIYTIPSTTTILVDAATGPYVITTFKPANGTYLEAQNLDFILRFNRTVNVTNFPRLPIIVGATTVYADYVSGTGTGDLTFRYIPTTAHSDLDGISLSGPIDLNGGTILDAGLKAAILPYAPPDATGILIDGTSPTITNVYGLGAGNILPGTVLYFKVVFSEVVITTPGPTLSINVGGAGQNATLISGSGTDTLTFGYTVQVGDDDTAVDITTPLVLNAGTIKDPRNHNASLIFVSTITSGYTVDGVASTGSMAAPINGTYKLGDILDFDVTWSEPTFITGVPRIALTIGATTRDANYYAEVGGFNLVHRFRYIVTATDLDLNGIATTGLQLNGGQIKDAAGNNANIAMALPNLTLVYVDGVVPFATITSYPANGTHKAGVNLTFAVTWSEAVTIVGVPEMRLTIGSTMVVAPYTSLTPTTGTFDYPIQIGQMDTNGIVLEAAIFLNGADTIKDAGLNDSYQHVNAPNLTGVKVDGIVPTIVTVVGPSNGTYKLDEYLYFDVYWSEPVTVVGTPRIALTLDTAPLAPTYATFVPGYSNPMMSVFAYQVLDGDIDAIGGISMTSPIDANGGTIRDAATNDADLTYTAPDLTNVLVDGARATITSWIPPANGVYGIGENLDITVHWSDPVDITGVPVVYFFDNGFRAATYLSGTGTNDIVFRYTVTEGEYNILGNFYIIGKVQLGAATIEDTSNNTAFVTFPNYPGVEWNPYSGVIVDGVRPTVTLSSSANISVASRPDYFTPSQVIEYSLTFDEVVNVLGAPQLTLDIGGTARVAPYFSGTGSNVLKFRIILDAAYVLLDLDGISVNTAIDMNGGSIRDIAPNDYTATFVFPEKDYVYFANTIGRYHVRDNDYTTSNAGCTGQCVVTIKDITGNGNDLAPSTVGPVVTSSIEFNSINYMQFNLSSYLRFKNLTPVRYAIFVMKNVSGGTVSVGLGTSSHNLLTRNDYSYAWNWHSHPGGPAFTPHIHNDPTIYSAYGHYYSTYSTVNSIQFASSAAAKTINMSISQKVKIDGAVFNPVAYATTVTSPTLWTIGGNNIYIHELSAASNYYPGSKIGGATFNGQIAEIIFISGAAVITEANLERIRDQLNTIYDVY